MTFIFVVTPQVMAVRRGDDLRYFFNILLGQVKTMLPCQGPDQSGLHMHYILNDVKIHSCS